MERQVLMEVHKRGGALYLGKWNIWLVDGLGNKREHPDIWWETFPHRIPGGVIERLTRKGMLRFKDVELTDPEGPFPGEHGERFEVTNEGARVLDVDEEAIEELWEWEASTQIDPHEFMVVGIPLGLHRTRRVEEGVVTVLGLDESREIASLLFDVASERAANASPEPPMPTLTLQGHIVPLEWFESMHMRVASELVRVGRIGEYLDRVETGRKVSLRFIQRTDEARANLVIARENSNAPSGWVKAADWNVPAFVEELLSSEVGKDELVGPLLLRGWMIALS